MSEGQAKLTPLGVFVTFILIAGLIGLGAWLLAGRSGGFSFGSLFGSKDSASSASQRPSDSNPGGSGTGTTGASTDANATAPTGVLNRIQAGGVLRVGMEPEAPPMNALDERGQREGFDFQLAFELARKLGVSRVDVVEADYDELPKKLRAGEVDIIMGGYVADPSIPQVNWTEGYLEFGLCMIAKQGSALTDPKQLTGRRVGIYSDEAAKTWVQENVSAVGLVREYQETGWFKALDNGEVDAIIYDYPFAVEEIKKFPRLKIVKLNLNSAQYSIGIPARNDDLLDALNKGIAEVTASESYDELVRKYLASSAVTVADVAKGAKVYVVKRGDTLTKIAQQELGDMQSWRKIYDLNKNRLANPHLIAVDFKLVMP
ncbi:MAG: transporter substrate-binding domain-containing protein [Rhizobacter sp.]|nr:transporter substrate-binding domain-containing protein [Chlorobiales bacterium]